MPDIFMPFTSAVLVGQRYKKQRSRSICPLLFSLSGRNLTVYPVESAVYTKLKFDIIVQVDFVAEILFIDFDDEPVGV
ncbi:MAG: hypothetical protein LBI60_03860, partial [Bacteroidales bacterium]|nr:hypothetical protein [Bacteroidales bacterium]